MALTKIEWTHWVKADGTVVPGYTFNPWEGCEKVSPACANCYAEDRDKRFHGGAHWGPSGTRKMMSESYWQQPLKRWDREAEAAGERRRVFCASLADVFEERPELVQPRIRLLNLIRRTPNLDWLLLTKRTQAILPIMTAARDLCAECLGVDGHQNCALVHQWLDDWMVGRAPRNVWLGTTVENQEQANKRIPELLKIPARIRFLSCEPLLGQLEFSDVTKRPDAISRLGEKAMTGIDWIICGGESGLDARALPVSWVRSLRNQCAHAGVAFFMKQGSESNWPNFKDFESFPIDLQVREYPVTEKDWDNEN